MRNVLAIVPKGNQEIVAAAIRTILAQPDAEHIHEQFEVISTMLRKQLPKVSQTLREAKDDLLAFTAFPVIHWNGHPLEGDLVDQPAGAIQHGGQAPHRRHRGIPNPGALLRLAGAVLVEAYDEWQVTRRYLSEWPVALLTEKNTEEVVTP